MKLTWEQKMSQANVGNMVVTRTYWIGKRPDLADDWYYRATTDEMYVGGFE